MNRTRYILLLTALLLSGSAGPARAQQSVRVFPDCIIFFNFTAATAGGNFDNKNSGCTDWTITYTNRGFSALSLVLQSAPNATGDVPGTWVTFAGTLVSGINPNTAITQATSAFNGYFPWIRVNLTSVTGSGRVQGIAYGMRRAASLTLSGTVTVVGPDANGSAPTGNPVQIAGWDGVDIRRILTDTSGRSRMVGAAAQGAAIAGDPLLLGHRDSSGNMQTEFECDQQAAISLTGSGNTEIIALTAAQTIRVCHVSIAAASALDLKFTRGTGTNCGTGTADVGGFYRNVTAVALDFGNKAPMKSASGEALCVNQSAAVNSGGIVIYAKF